MQPSRSSGAREVVRRQAHVARLAIGKPLGEDAHVADKVYRKRNGSPLDLLLLGDSIAAGLGADRPKRTLGAQLAKRLADRSERAVRLRTAADRRLRDLDAARAAGRSAARLRRRRGRDRRRRQRRRRTGSGPRSRALIWARRSPPSRHAGRAWWWAPVPTSERSHPCRSRCGRWPGWPRASWPPPSATSSPGSASARSPCTTSSGRSSWPSRTTMFAVDRFHPSSAGYRRTAKAMLPSVLAALGYDTLLPFGHHEPLPGPTPPGMVRCHPGRDDDDLRPPGGSHEQRRHHGHRGEPDLALGRLPGRPLRLRPQGQLGQGVSFIAGMLLGMAAAFEILQGVAAIAKDGMFASGGRLRLQAEHGDLGLDARRDRHPADGGGDRDARAEDLGPGDRAHRGGPLDHRQLRVPAVLPGVVAHDHRRQHPHHLRPGHAAGAARPDA